MRERSNETLRRERSDETLFAEPEEKLVDAVRKDKAGTSRAIFNTMPDEKTRALDGNRDDGDPKEKEDDDLGVIPSFLRRSKLR